MSRADRKMRRHGNRVSVHATIPPGKVWLDYYAKCDCGWTSELTSQDAAQRAGDAHSKELCRGKSAKGYTLP